MSEVISKKKILVAPLNWGLGHASRCIPIIRALIQQGFQPVLASDGGALELLQKEFPLLKTYQLPSYDIRYSHRAKWMPIKLLSQVPHVMRAVKKEHRLVRKLVEREEISGIISDNRFGVYSNKVPSVYLTHQLKVLAGAMTATSSWLHGRIIRRFDQCWVCDWPGDASLAGALTDVEKSKNLRFIGPLSRFSPGTQEKGAYEVEVDICFVLSGPEPQRSALQQLIEKEFADHPASMVLVEGLVEGKVSNRKVGNIKIFNYLLSEDLESLFKNSRIVVSRSGYSSVMDLDAMGSTAYFVPTPGQGEQEYLARYLKSKGVAGFSEQADFSRSSLSAASEFEGFIQRKTPNKNQFKGLFDVFK